MQTTYSPLHHKVNAIHSHLKAAPRRHAFTFPSIFMAALALASENFDLPQSSWRNALPWVIAALIAHIVLIAAFFLLQPSQPQTPEVFSVSLLPMSPPAPTPPAPAPKSQPVVKATPKPTVMPKPAPVPTPSAISQPKPTAAPSTAEDVPSTPPSGADKPNPANTASEPIYNASYLNNPRPPYPPLSTRFGEEGVVKLEVQVQPDGTAGRVSLYKSSGYSRLDDVALMTVKRWKFVPAKRGGEAVAASVIVPVNFHLEK
ncbi:MAG TPA: TonB family protein [Rhodocyclaceae bacterium]|nr:TonB family protein [Rhodocyclaceae bacterium]